MRKTPFKMLFFLLAIDASAQPVAQKLQQAFQQFETDDQLRHAVSSLYVIDVTTGQVVFEKNGQVGLAPASTQKIVTATTAFELLGKDFRYNTQIVYNGKLKDGVLDGGISLLGSGDPTLGSWRWPGTKDSFLLNKWYQDIKKAGIKRIEGPVWFAARPFSAQSIPNGWIWQDIGNYYGAGTNLLNWKENQYDIVLRSSDTIGSKVKILSPSLEDQDANELKAAPKGSGDNAYKYYDDMISGTIPIGERAFKISAADTRPFENLCFDLSWYLSSKNIHVEAREKFYTNIFTSGNVYNSPVHVISSHYSPSLDSVIYWFLQRSINLYGEALVKTLAFEKKGFGSTDSGVALIKDFWKQKGIDEDELNISDGSGLSPQNRVTTHAQVEILKYAKKQPWFSYFYTALPEYNGMKMKSGTIKDVKGFCGYHKAKDGKEYIFSFLVNNYSGKASGLVSKMYTVLDVLK